MEKLTKQIYFYPVVIEPLEEGGYFAECPILQGCHAEGASYGETIDNIRDVIKVHLELRKKHKDIIPFIRVKKQSDVGIQIPVPIGN